MILGLFSLQRLSLSPSTSSLPRPLEDPQALRRFVERLREGIYVTSRSGAILDANPAFLEVTGLESLEEARRTTVQALLAHPDQRDRQLEILEREGGVREYEIELVRADGERRTVVDTCFTIPGPDGEEQLYGILVDITGRKRLEARLRELSLRDPLTGCWNRRHLEALGRELEARDGATWGVVVLDIDRFKDFNDLHGHAEGDRVLRRMGRFLYRQSRADDPVVRMGGDEFLLLLLEEDAASVESVARRLSKAAATDAPAPFSLGWAERDGEEELARTIERADRQLLAVRSRERRSGRRRT